MLLYFYTMEYPGEKDTKLLKSSREEQFFSHVDLYAVADKYDVPALKTTIAAIFADELSGLVGGYEEELPYMAELIRAVYKST